MRKILLIVLLFSLTAFSAKTRYLPQYQPETQVNDDVLAFLNQDSLRLENVKRFVRNKTTRDILGRLSKDTTINPYEVVDFYTQSNANLKFEIRRFVNSQSDDVILGFAMRCDND